MLGEDILNCAILALHLARNGRNDARMWIVTRTPENRKTSVNCSRASYGLLSTHSNSQLSKTANGVRRLYQSVPYLKTSNGLTARLWVYEEFHAEPSAGPAGANHFQETHKSWTASCANPYAIHRLSRRSAIYTACTVTDSFTHLSICNKTATGYVT